MYMFFWFFKQLYYCLRRIFKSGILLLFIFFIAFLLLFTHKVKAVTYPDIYSDILTDYPAIKKVYDNTWNYYHNTYGNNLTIVICRNNDGTITSNCFNPNQVTFYFDNNNMIVRSTGTSSTYGGSWYYANGDNRTHATYNLTGSVTSSYNKDLYLYSNVYLYNLNNTVVYPSLYGNPQITTTDSSIINWSFDTLNITGGSLSTNYVAWLNFDYEGNRYSFSLNPFMSTTSGLYFSIPRNVITQYIVVRNGSTISFDITLRGNGENLNVLNYNLGTYTLSLTSQEETTINEDSNKEIISSLYNTGQEINNSINQQTTIIQEQTNAINNQTNAINNQTDKIEEQTNAINEQTDYLQDDTINNNSIYLPQDNSNDITQDGLNGIFTTIYNAFCTGQAQDIVFPIPFTNKNITLQANYVRNMLTNSNSTWVITIIEAFWWFLISRYIIKDITNKITKIKSGNIEDIETTNIKGDML